MEVTQTHSKYTSINKEEVAKPSIIERDVYLHRFYCTHPVLFIENTATF